MNEKELECELKQIEEESIYFLLGYYNDSFLRGLRTSWRKATDKQANLIQRKLWEKLVKNSPEEWLG